MLAYADTSFLVSLYVLEGNSASAAAKMKTVSLPLMLSTFGEVELTNAIGLRQFRKEITASAARASYKLISKDIQDGVLSVKSVPASAFERARQIARKLTPQLGTRTLDVLHVACALSFQATDFYTFDLRQAKLARRLGLRLP